MEFSDARERWVVQLGLAYNPFQHPEASSDPHLGDYLVDHHVSTHVRRQEPVLVFAPHGGGKTALRLLAARQAWIERRALPVAYLLPLHARWREHFTFGDHLRGLARATAVALFICLAFRPELALGLNATETTKLAALLNAHLPVALDYCLSILRDAGTPTVLSSHLDRVFILPDPPAAPAFQEFCDKLAAHLPPDKPAPISAESSWRAQCEIILDALAFPALELLVDGVDATPRTYANPAAEVDWVAPLFERAPQWAAEKIFFKAFLPEDMRQALRAHAPQLYETFVAATLEWSPQHLEEMLRRRIYAASRGAFDSLDLIASPGVQNIERQIAQVALPRPREAIALTQRVLETYAARIGAEDGDILAQDLEQSFEAYKVQVKKQLALEFSGLGNFQATRANLELDPA